ncbi:transmembrane protein, putative (macronuclear) [Tetrahymena thermophila SB210]|uniref:Transmembrane protein, putative n=1 Tax=Tetrahymena thermophila (strain SB210) TaxID=312017 RepID=W7X4K3_TETTS|nr:transmembrane protein, putative [Tetrahymena thermophila SB210]EWS74265.1 transmembrane protein, putative [Tetrahymena thermophila SB210]|eukprot:XP_012653238.1 transmembrane protein, putative [Tetrahymena thermophila SB210]
MIRVIFQTFRLFFYCFAFVVFYFSIKYLLLNCQINSQITFQNSVGLAIYQFSFWIFTIIAELRFLQQFTSLSLLLQDFIQLYFILGIKQTQMMLSKQIKIVVKQQKQQLLWNFLQALFFYQIQYLPIDNQSLYKPLQIVNNLFQIDIILIFILIKKTILQDYRRNQSMQYLFIVLCNFFRMVKKKQKIYL